MKDKTLMKAINYYHFLKAIFPLYLLITIYIIKVFILDIDVGALIIFNKLEQELAPGAGFMFMFIFILESIQKFYFISCVVLYYIFSKNNNFKRVKDNIQIVFIISFSLFLTCQCYTIVIREYFIYINPNILYILYILTFLFFIAIYDLKNKFILFNIFIKLIGIIFILFNIFIIFIVLFIIFFMIKIIIFSILKDNFNF